MGRVLLHRFLLSYVAYLGSGGIVFLLTYLYYHSRIWQKYDSFYRFVQFCQRNIGLLLIIYAAAGALGIGALFLLRSCSYLDELLEASETLFEEPEKKVALSSGLLEYEGRLNEIKDKVKASQLAARDAEQRKNDLVVYLAHDLKTPLTSVIGYLTLLSDEREISQELQEKYLQIALDKAERLEDLINEFFEITRFSLTHLSLEISRINLTRMIEQTIYEFQPMLQEKELTCRLEAPRDYLFACDPEKLQRVFDNLLRNAVSYGDAGTAIEICLQAKETFVELTVSNQGPEIPQEKLERIFEQFFRLDSARASRNGGSGLGLAIAKEIVELHGGTITAKSQKNHITFEVTLPVRGRCD